MKKIVALLMIVVLVTNAHSQDIDLQNIGKAKKFAWSGSLGATTNYYNTTAGEKHSLSPFNWNLNGNVNLSIMGVFNLPFSFVVGKYESSITKPKPFTQFGITPTYKWAKLHLGYRNITFNPYTLSGHTFFGAGVELTPRKFRFAAMYGRLKPAIEIDTNNIVTIPSFKRSGYGLKLGYGNDSNFIDVMFFHAADDVNSINWQNEEIQKKLKDANPLLPVKNNVMGVSAKTTIAKVFVAQVDGGISFYDPNTTDIQVDPDLEKVDLSQKINWAGKASIGYQLKNHNLKFDYERILPGYISLGSYFFNTDIRNFTFSPSGTFVKGKVSYALSAGMQKNNLDKKKTETTKRFIGNGNLSINPSAFWGISTNYNNFGTYQQPGTLPLKDSTRIRQVNQTITVSPHFTIVQDTVATHTFNLTGTLNDVNDKNIVTKEYGNMKAMMISFNHVSSFNKHGNSLNSGLNYNNIKTAALVNTQYGATIGYSQAFFNSALNTTININYNRSYIDHKNDGSILNGTLTMSCTVAKRHTFNLSFNMISTKSKQFEDYVETIGSVGYTVPLK